MKLSKRTRIIFLILFVAIGATNRCDCDEESMEVPSEIDVVGTWILKSAEFREEVDLDGDGPMSPVKDIKYLLLNLLNVYATCSSMDEMPIQFSNEIVSPATSEDPENKFGVYAVCTAGQGVTSQIAMYYMDPYRSDGFYMEIDELNDPADLFDWNGNMLFIITQDITVDGVRVLHGTSSIIPKGTSRYQHFDFILEEYAGV